MRTESQKLRRSDGPLPDLLLLPAAQAVVGGGVGIYRAVTVELHLLRPAVKQTYQISHSLSPSVLLTRLQLA